MKKAIKNANIIVKLSRMNWLQRIVFSVIMATAGVSVGLPYLMNIKTPVPNTPENNMASKIIVFLKKRGELA